MAGDGSALTVLAGAQLAFVHCLAGQIDEAYRACDVALTRAGLYDERWATSWVMWARGLTDYYAGEYAASVYALQTAIAAKDSFNDWLGVAACVELLAWNAVESGETARAATLLAIGKTLCGAVGGYSPLFGAPALMQTREAYEVRARRELGSEAFERNHRAGAAMDPHKAVAFALGRTTRPVPAITIPAFEGLTSREIEISRLIADGLSNNDIARQLTISRRTVEGHVNRILAKLNFRSRSQVAAWVVSGNAVTRISS
jgi:non-specific serine/threonine protein kinase